METIEILLHEYNNLWSEKEVHLQGIRKFHNYLTYITAIGSIALAVHGLNTQDIISSAIDSHKADVIAKNSANILHLFFISFTPVLFITLIFPINDLFHIFAIGYHVGEIEKRINQIAGEELLLWENKICPKVFGGEPDHQGNRLVNIINKGDYLLLFPALLLLCIVSIGISISYIWAKSVIGALFYIVLVIYMFSAIIYLALKLKNYISPSGELSKIIQNTHIYVNSKENLGTGK